MAQNSPPIYDQQQVPSQPIIANNYNYGADPLQVQCFNCHAVVTTRKIESPNVLCKLFSNYSQCKLQSEPDCCRFGFWAFCCPGCQDVEHRCPNCNVILGTHKP